MVFASETVIVLVMLLFVRRINDEPAADEGKLDLGGAALSAAGLGLLVFGILKISSWGLFKPVGALTINGTEITPFGFSVVPFLIAAGLGVLIVFSRYELRQAARGRTPLLPHDLLRIPQMRAGLSTVVSQYLIIAGVFFVLPLYLQLVLGKDALQTGLKILPISVSMMVAAMAGPRLAARRSPRMVSQWGLGILFVGIIGVMATIAPSLASVQFAVSLAFFGTGVGLVISQMGNVVMSSVPDSRSSEAGGVQGASQNLGQSLGTALIGAVLLTGLTTGFQDRVRADSSIPQPMQQKVLSSTEQGLQMVSASQFEQAAKDAGVPQREIDTLVSHYSDAQIEALKKALLVASFFALIGVWFARALPGEPLARDGPAAEAEPEAVAQPA